MTTAINEKNRYKIQPLTVGAGFFSIMATVIAHIGSCVLQGLARSGPALLEAAEPTRLPRYKSSHSLLQNVSQDAMNSTVEG